MKSTHSKTTISQKWQCILKMVEGGELLKAHIPTDQPTSDYNRCILSQIHPHPSLTVIHTSFQTTFNHNMPAHVVSKCYILGMCALQLITLKEDGKHPNKSGTGVNGQMKHLIKAPCPSITQTHSSSCCTSAYLEARLSLSLSLSLTA